jgi:hypothetical protein
MISWAYFGQKARHGALIKAFGRGIEPQRKRAQLHVGLSIINVSNRFR